MDTDRINEREREILRSLVYDFITTGKPVGSRSFVQKYSFSISPATMRNIMADLESMGYLMQPHTSSGRIPTDRGYRFYVDSLLEKYNHDIHENVHVNEELIKRELQLEKIFCEITKMLSGITSYAGVMLTPRLDLTVVKRLELIPLDGGEVLIIIVTRTGIIINKKVTISAAVTRDDLFLYSNFLTESLCGYTLRDIREDRINELRDYVYELLQRSDGQVALDIAQLGMNIEEEPELCIDGIENLLKIPEMVEEKRLNSLLSIIEEKNILRSIMETTLEADGVRIIIGDEIEHEKVSGCSMVTTAYKIGNKKVGVVGVIGPTRMNYQKVVPLVDYTGKIVSDLLTKIST